MAMARVQLADLEKRAGWVYVISKGSLGIESPRLSKGLRGWRLKGSKIIWESCLQVVEKDITRKETPYVWSVSTQCTRNARKTEQWARESSVIMTELFHGPRGSGAVETLAASGNPSFAGPPLALGKRARSGTSAGGAADE